MMTKDKKNITKQIIAYILVLSMCIMSSCANEPIIKYGVEVVETEESDAIEFSFEKKIDTEQKSKVVTKKERDFQISEKITDLISKRTRPARKIRGVYLPAYVVGKEDRFNPIFENIKNSCINAIVVDVKDELGRITFNIDSDYIRGLGTTREAQIKDIDAFVKLCKDNDIYLIARISSFFDKYINKNTSHFFLKRIDGKYYSDYKGWHWLNPYNEEVKKYLIEIGKGCAKAGFDEVQYDYFRFSGEQNLRRVEFPDEMTKGKSRIEIITELAQDIYQELITENIYVSIDVFGAIMNSYGDQDSIGQDYTTLLKYTDYLCPMIYPSHYANKTFGLDVPDLQPYESIKSALETSNNTIARVKDDYTHFGIVRPWLQGFTANYIPEYRTYGVDEYKEEIKAVEDMGGEEWLFWNPGGVYKWDAFMDGSIKNDKTDITNKTSNTDNVNVSE